MELNAEAKGLGGNYHALMPETKYAIGTIRRLTSNTTKADSYEGFDPAYPGTRSNVSHFAKVTNEGSYLKIQPSWDLFSKQNIFTTMRDMKNPKLGLCREE